MSPISPNLCLQMIFSIIKTKTDRSKKAHPISNFRHGSSSPQCIHVNRLTAINSATVDKILQPVQVQRFIICLISEQEMSTIGKCHFCTL